MIGEPEAAAVPLPHRGDQAAGDQVEEADRLDRLVEEAVRASVAPSTARAYRIGWEHFVRWCGPLKVDPVEASGDDVARFAAAKAAAVDGYGQRRWKTSTIGLWVTAVGQVLAAAGGTDVTRSPVVRRTMAGLRRETGTRPRRMRPLGLAEVRQVLEVMDFTTWPAAVKATRDAAILLVGLAGGFRRSELSALDLGDLEGQESGAVHVLVRRSKTDQEGQGLVKFLPRGQHPELCPACALWRWVALVRLADRGASRSAMMATVQTTSRSIHVCQNPPELEGRSLLRPLFRAVQKTGGIVAWAGSDSPRQEEAPRRSRYRRPDADQARLSGAGIHQMIRGRALAAGFNPTLFGAHSLRAGLITDAFRQGADTQSIRRQTGHKSDAVLAAYDRDYNPGTNNAATRLGF